MDVTFIGSNFWAALEVDSPQTRRDGGRVCCRSSCAERPLGSHCATWGYERSIAAQCVLYMLVSTHPFLSYHFHCWGFDPHYLAQSPFNLVNVFFDIWSEYIIIIDPACVKVLWLELLRGERNGTLVRPSAVECTSLL